MEPLKTERLSGSCFMDILERGQVSCELFVFLLDFNFSVDLRSFPTCYQTETAATANSMMTQTRLHNVVEKCCSEKSHVEEISACSSMPRKMLMSAT